MNANFCDDECRGDCEGAASPSARSVQPPPIGCAGSPVHFGLVKNAICGAIDDGTIRLCNVAGNVTCYDCLETALSDEGVYRLWDEHDLVRHARLVLKKKQKLSAQKAGR